MKVLYLATGQHFLDTHAGFSHAFNISRALAERGHQLTLLMRPPRSEGQKRTGKSRVLDGMKKGDRLELSDNLTIRFVDWRFFGNFISYPRALYTLKKLDSNFQLVHERYELHGNTGKYLARLNNIPFILEANSPFVEEFFSPRSPLFQLFRFSRHTNFRAANRVVVQATQLKDIFSGIIPPEKIRVVSNGVDPELFDPARIPDPGELLNAGDREFGKRVEDWVRDFSRQWFLGSADGGEGTGEDIARELEDRAVGTKRQIA